MNEIRRTALFYAAAEKRPGEPQANVGVITDTYQKAFEPINLLGRHNIPFAVLKASELKPQSLDAFNLIIVFAVPDQPVIAAISDFASKGGIVVLVGVPGSYPWQSGQSIPAGENSVAYAVGKGRIIELPGPVIDPETFAQDIRRLIGPEKSRCQPVECSDRHCCSVRFAGRSREGGGGAQLRAGVNARPGTGQRIVFLRHFRDA